MLFSAPEQFIVIAIVLIAGYLLGFASRPGTRKWKAKVRDQAESFTAYHADAEDRLRAAKQRATALEAETASLRADHDEARRTIAALKAAPPRPPLALVETPAAPVAAHPESAETTRDEHLADAYIAPVPADAVVASARVEEARRDPGVKPVAETHAAPVEAAAPLAVADAPHKDAGHTGPDHETSLAEFPMTPTPSDAAPAPIGPAEPEMPAQGWFGNSSRDDLTRIRGIDNPLNTRLFGLGVLRFEDLEKLSAEDEMALEERLALPVGTIARDQWRGQSAMLRAGRDEEHATHFGEVAEDA